MVVSKSLIYQAGLELLILLFSLPLSLRMTDMVCHHIWQGDAEFDHPYHMTTLAYQHTTNTCGTPQRFLWFTWEWWPFFPLLWNWRVRISCFILFLNVTGDQVPASYVLDNCSITEPYPQPDFFRLNSLIMSTIATSVFWFCFCLWQGLVQSRLAVKSLNPCLHFPSDGLTDGHYHKWLASIFFNGFVFQKEWPFIYLVIY